MRDLTNREFEVLELIMKGFSNNQIAEKLYITNDTVKAHVKNIFRKFHTKNRIETVVKAIKFEVVKI